MAQKSEKKNDKFVVNFMLGGVAGAISKVRLKLLNKVNNNFLMQKYI